MLEFILEYWLNFLLTAIAGGLGIVCRKIWKMYKNEKNQQESARDKQLYDNLKNTIEQGDKTLQDQVNILTKGILSIQGKTFKQECRELLEEDHEITLEEFLLLQEDHSIYKSLGGNHDGDTLFNMVEAKTQVNLTEK